MAEHDTRRTISADAVTGGQEAYIEAIRRAEAAAELVEVETPSPLPDAVPVQASDQPLLPEAEPAVPAETPAPEAVEEQTPAEEAVEKLFAGKYKSPEELEAAYLEAQSALGRQGQEVGELRAAFDTLSAEVAASKPQLAPVTITQDLIDTNPAQATLLAYEQRNEQALQIAFDAWKDEDPFTAGSWLAEKRDEQREQALRQELDAVRSEMQTLSKPQQEAEERKQWSDAFAIVSKDHPDFVQNAARILEEVAPKYPALTGTLATGSAEAKAEILAALYSLDRNGNPAEIAAQLQQEAEAAAQEAEANRNGSTVVTQTTAGQGSAVELTAEQEEQERYKQRFESGPSLEKGWTGRAA